MTRQARRSRLMLMMESEDIPILMLEDSVTDAALEERALKKSGLACNVMRVESESAFMAALREFRPLLILADYALPAFDGLSALSLAKAECPAVPFVMVSGNRGEELAVEALQRGADDYVLKAGLHRLAPAVKRALATAAERVKLGELEASLRLQSAALRAATDGILITSLSGRIEWVNPALCAQSGFSEAELLGETPRLFKSGRHNSEFYRDLWDTIRSGKPWSGEMVNRHRNGSLYSKETVITPVQNQAGETTHFIAVNRDMSAQKEAENEIRKLAAFPRCNPNPIMGFTSAGEVAYANAAAEELAAQSDCPGIRLLPDNIEELVRECLATGRIARGREMAAGKRTVSWSYYPITELNVVHGYAIDITERLELERQLRQAQKMEAVGQLSGGVAHDFNNLLSVIMGHAELALMPGAAVEQMSGALHEILEASQRAAGLTRQLLTFSRRQPMERERVNLNEVVENMTKMLRRLLGEDVALEFEPAASLPPVLADVGMMEQVIMNLAVNARDAMPTGGRLTISSCSELIDDEYVLRNCCGNAGEYVCLCVQDTGAGISDDVQEHVFEPFFTTKEVGKGTGLGLSTVFGIISQHDGWIRIFSELGHGTLFRIYLPRCASVPDDRGDEEAGGDSKQSGGAESILLVEDDPSVRLVARMALSRAGYHVLECENGPEALGLWQEKGSDIDILFTDMIMPGGMSGLELAAKLRDDRPELPVVFTSGFTGDISGNAFEIDGNSRFLQKPYPSRALLTSIRESLDCRNSSQGAGSDISPG